MDTALLQTAVWPSFGTLREAVLIVDQQGYIHYINPAASKLLCTDLSISLENTLIANASQWQTLLTPPFTTTLEIESNSFHVDAYPHFNELIQIQLSPDSHNREFEVLLESSQAITGTLDTGMVLALMGQQMVDAVDGRGYVIYQWKQEEAALIVLRDEGETAVFPTLSPLSSDSPIYTTIKTQSPTVVEADNSVIFPIIIAEEVYGAIVIFMPNTAPDANGKSLRLLSALSNQANTALETALIYEDIFHRERFYNALGRINLAINFTLRESDVMSLISSESLHMFGVDGAFIWQVVDDALIGVAAHGNGIDGFLGSSLSVANADAFILSIIQAGEPRYINNLSEADLQMGGFPAPDVVRSILAIPFMQEEVVTAVLALIYTHNSSHFTEADITQAVTFGMQISTSLQNVHLFKQLRELNADLDERVAQRTRELNQESERFKTLLKITAKLSDNLDENYVLNQALLMASEVVKATHGLIMLFDALQGKLVTKATIGTYRTVGTEAWSIAFAAQDSLAQMVMEEQTAVIIPDSNQEPHWQNPLPHDKLTSIMAVPLVANEEAIGVLMLFHPEPAMFTAQQVELVEAAAIQVTISINNANLYRFIREQADRMEILLQDETVEAAKHQAILESIADGVIVANEDGEIVLANKTAVDILGISQRQLITKHIKNLIGIYGDSQHEWLRTIEHWHENAGDIQLGLFLRQQFEIGEKIVLVHLSPILVQGEYLGIVSIFRDITKEVEVDRLKINFISTISHELRTPMTSIKGYADLLLMGAAGELNNGQVDYLSVIEQNAERMHMLVNDLLDISEIGAEKMALNLQTLDISDIVTEMVDEYLNGRVAKEGKSLTVESNIAPRLPLIRADPKRIIQILTNLIDNAFNYTPEYGRIRVDAYSDDNNVSVAIEDTGIGISDNDFANIFDRFYRSGEADVQKISGTGLGLSIVQTLVDMHGGILNVKSKEHEGTTFTISFPIM